jgi:hypothetical protein
MTLFARNAMPRFRPTLPHAPSAAPCLRTILTYARLPRAGLYLPRPSRVAVQAAGCPCTWRTVSATSVVSPSAHLVVRLLRMKLTAAPPAARSSSSSVRSATWNCSRPLPSAHSAMRSSRVSVRSATAACPVCASGLVVRQRPLGHRVAFSFAVACSECDTHYDPLQSACPGCRSLVCPHCLRRIYPGERRCAACGADLPDYGVSPCPRCGRLVEKGETSCPSCEQEICSECGAAVTGDLCASCGAEFESYCPRCNAVLKAADTVCPGCGLRFDD